MRFHWRKLLAVFCLLLVLAGCGKMQGQQEAGEDAKALEPPLIGLILTSRDHPENDKVTGEFEKVAQEEGAKFRLCVPDVSWEEAQEASAYAGETAICEVNPLEYQMLLVNDLVAEGADVIAIHANHEDELEPVLSAARAVGVKVCAFGQEVNENCRDVYAQTEEAAKKTAGLLN